MALEHGHRVAIEGAVLRDDAAHLLLDPLEVRRSELLREIDVVVEAVGHRRPDGELRTGPEAQDGVRHDVRRGVRDDHENRPATGT